MLGDLGGLSGTAAGADFHSVVPPAARDSTARHLFTASTTSSKMVAQAGSSDRCLASRVAYLLRPQELTLALSTQWCYLQPGTLSMVPRALDRAAINTMKPKSYRFHLQPKTYTQQTLLVVLLSCSPLRNRRSSKLHHLHQEEGAAVSRSLLRRLRLCAVANGRPTASSNTSPRKRGQTTFYASAWDTSRTITHW